MYLSLVLFKISFQNSSDIEICAEMLNQRGGLSTITDLLKRSKIVFLIGPFLLFGYYFDLIKDVILIYRLTHAIGGIAVVFESYEKFPCMIIILLLGTVLLPLLLAGIRISIQCPNIIFGDADSENNNSVKNGCITFCLTPLLRLLMSLKLHTFYLIEKLGLDTKGLYKQKSNIKYHLRQMDKLELGMETIYQLCIQLILLFNALSETRTSEGFSSIFEDGQNVWSSILLSFSISWSFISCSMSHIKGLSKSRDHFPAVSKAIIGLCTVIAIIKSVLCKILYFTPPLGLFSLLRHLQAEQTRFANEFSLMGEGLDENGMFHFGNSPPLAWKLIERWNRDTNQPPDYTFYSILSLKMYFIVFVLLTICQTFTIFLVKTKWSRTFSNITFLDKMIHCIENTNIPYPVEEWDAGLGNADEYFKRMKESKTEQIPVIIVNLVYNIVYLVPIFCLAVNITIRHDFLYNSIGYLPEEQQAYQNVWIISVSSLAFVLLGSFIEAALFIAYNEKFHPFKDIIANIASKKDEHEPIPMNDLQ